MPVKKQFLVKYYFTAQAKKNGWYSIMPVYCEDQTKARKYFDGQKKKPAYSKFVFDNITQQEI